MMLGALIRFYSDANRLLSESASFHYALLVKSAQNAGNSVGRMFSLLLSRKGVVYFSVAAVSSLTMLTGAAVIRGGSPIARKHEAGYSDTAPAVTHVASFPNPNEVAFSEASASAANEEIVRPKIPGPSLRIGDRIDLAVFERLAHDRWGNSREQLPDLSRSFLQRMELSGERRIQDNGCISLPFLGQIPADGFSNQDLETAVAKAFEQAFHRPAFVTILSVQHNPVFIVGLVKNPGSYKYETGMTILHAIALAGGLERPAQEAWLAIEAAREEARAERSILTVSRALARSAVLRAERDATEAAVPGRLIRLVGDSAARAALEDQKALRSLVVATHKAREESLRSAISSAKTEFELAQSRIPPLETSVNLRAERLRAVASLNSTGTASRAQLIEVQATLSEAESKKQEALQGVAAAKRRVDQTEGDLRQFDLEYRAQLEQEISAADRQSTEELDSIIGSQGTLAAIKATNDTKPTDVVGLRFEILRRTAEGSNVIAAEEATELTPGDLVRVKRSDQKTRRSEYSDGSTAR